MPQSLFARLTLTLIAVLAVAHLAAALLFVQERGEVFYRAAGMQIAQRIGAVTRLLDDKSEAQRREIIDAFQGGVLRIELDDAPRLAEVENDWRGTLFHTLLGSQLDGRRPLHIAIDTPRPLPGEWGGWGRGERRSPPEPWEVGPRGRGPGAGMEPGPRSGMGRGMGRHGRWGGHRGPPNGVTFRAEVELSDGRWVRFQRVLPEEAFEAPIRLFGGIALLLLAVVVVSLLAVRALIRPLTTLAHAADELGRDIQRPPLPEQGPREVRQAARAFNTMQGRIGRYLEDRGRLLAAVSHDLKTPITRLRLRTEMLDDEATREKFQTDLEEMERMVGATLDFMRGLDEKEPRRPLAVDALLESLREEFVELHPDASIILAGTAETPYPAHPTALKRCLRNLMENALNYAGDLEVAVEDHAESLTLHILDRGPGVPADALESLFEPFRRLEESRARDTGGSGLGLGIARNIARAHGGDVTLHNRPDGGLEARLTLPR